MSSCGPWDTSRSTTVNRSTRERAAITGSTSAATTIAATAAWISPGSISSCGQFVSFLAERRVLAGRVRLATTDLDENERVPFFLLPTLGGNNTLRGFRAYRFRGLHSILLQGEYRWEIWSAFDAAIFYDAGKVAMRREDLNFKSLEHDYGIGFRFNTDNGIIVRVDAAFGSKDGKHLHIVFGGIF